MLPPSRSASSLGDNAWSYAAIPLIYIFMFGTRALTLIGFNPLFKWLGTGASCGTLRSCWAHCAGFCGAEPRTFIRSAKPPAAPFA
jgi:hypothetical protein